MENISLDFLFIAPTPFYANRGCHMRIRGEAEALQKKGFRVKIVTYRDGEDIPGLLIKRSFYRLGTDPNEVAASWKNLPASFFLFWTVLHETVYCRPRVLYGHLFHGGAIAVAAKYLSLLLTLFQFKPLLVLDTQGSLSNEMREYGMVKGNFFLSAIRWLEKFILFFPDLTFVSSWDCLVLLKKISARKNICLVPDGISFFDTKIYQKKSLRLTAPKDKKQAIAKLRGTLAKDEILLLFNWLKERKKIILYTGSFAWAKGLGIFISEALSALIKNNHLRFLFAGGNLTKLPPEALSQLKANREKIIVSPNLNAKNLLYFNLLGDIALDLKPPHSSESSGKILNYMAAGLPVVCFDKKNNRFFLGKNGLYAKNYPDFVKLILNLSGNSYLRNRIRRENLKRAWGVFTWDKAAEKIIKTCNL